MRGYGSRNELLRELTRDLACEANGLDRVGIQRFLGALDANSPGTLLGALAVLRSHAYAIKDLAEKIDGLVDDQVDALLDHESR